jgi:single-strand DNA-binding protein
MTMTATVYGRCAFDPRQHITQTGKPMTTARLAVDVTGRDESDQQTMWVDVLAFGRSADDLSRAEKGQHVSAMGKVTRGTYTTKDGTEREQWTLLADGVVTARSGRPGGRKSNGAQVQNRASAQQQAPADFDDRLPF